MGVIKVLGWLRVLVLFAMPFAILAEYEGKPGAEKRAEVVALLKAEMQRQGFVVPEWLARFLDPLLGVIVDVVVTLLNRMGFFDHSGDSSAP